MNIQASKGCGAPINHVDRRQPAPMPELRPAPEMQRARPMPVSAQPQPLLFVAAQPAAKPAPRPDYDEMVEHLEPMIQRQLAEVQRALLERGLRPEDVQLVYAIDITGRETSVCLACGIEGHDFQPTQVRLEALAIDMLTESLVVFQEVASRLGAKYGLLAYDDGGVLVLRRVSAASSPTTRANAAARFQAFRDRFGKVQLQTGALRSGVVVDKAWLAAEAKSWVPSDASRAVVGQAQDVLAINTVAQIKDPHGGPCLAVFAKNQAPTTALRTAELLANRNGIALSGVAVGSQAPRNFLKHTVVAPTMHDLRTHLGRGLKLAIDQAIQKENAP